MGDARRAALTVLERCRRSGAWSDAVLGSVLDAERLDPRDRGLTAALCYGVQQNLLLLDCCIGQYSDRKLNKVEPKVADILRIGAYQLLFMKKIPASAAVNEGVKLCRSLGYDRAAGYVNAVLRRLAAAPELPEISGTTAQRLSVRYSHPRWLVDALLDRLGEGETEAFLRSDNAVPAAALQVNTLRATAEDAEAALRAEGLDPARHPAVPDCLLLDAPGDLTRLDAFRAGLFYVQDPAARCAVLAAAPAPGQNILDLCAAPGGKSFAAAILSGGRAEVTACDLHENKLKRLREGAARLGLDRQIQTRAGDGRVFRPEWDSAFDLVIADVPCSGLGVIRKKPDIRYKDPAAFRGLPEVQAALLANAARYVRPGGTLLYSTCTVRREENEAVAEGFLLSHPSFAPADFTTPWGEGSEGGLLQLWPQRQGADGFFIAKMRRQA